MEIDIQFVQLATNESVKALAVKKLGKLAERYDWLIKAAVFYKLENDPTGKGKICEMRLSLPGPRIFASSDETSFEAATEETLNDLEKQLKKRKSEMNSY